MAKKRDWDNDSLNNSEKYASTIKRLFLQLVQEAAGLGVGVNELSEDRIFSFSDYPKTKALSDKLIKKLANGIEVSIANGIRSAWTLSNNKNNELARRLFGDNVGKLNPAQYRRYFSNNDNAMEAFIKRKTGGLSLSERVWRYAQQFKAEIEMGLDVGIRNGQSAQEIARDLKQYLQNPDKLFRRVRDIHGNLVLSKAAKAYHSGRGVYRSAHKNAMRLARTETNMAYRNSDHERWNNFDFVVGIEIKLSNNPNHCPMCAQLVGKYPKNFKFSGWHPQCRCKAVPILKTAQEFEQDNSSILLGKPISGGGGVNEVSTMPANFNKWYNINKERINRASSLPYWMNDNKKLISSIGEAKPVVKKADEKSKTFKTVIDRADEAKVVQNEVKDLKNELTETQIIERLGGGDLTKGSCSSLAFAYAGNRNGMDVLDFRDGDSRTLFAKMSTIEDICLNAGGVVSKNVSDFVKAKELLSNVVEGKEYYFTSGSHAAIVRKKDKKFEYLELQSSKSNGFKELNNDVLKKRFKAKKSRTFNRRKIETKDVIIDIDLLNETQEFKNLLGYINTQPNKQKKGLSGTTK